MKSVLTVLFAFAFAGVVAAQGAGAKASADKPVMKPCDMKTVEKAPYCAKCNKIDPKCDDKGMCCGAKPESVDVCVKTTFSCSDCNMQVLEEKACCKDAKCEKTVTKCRVVCKCEGCGKACKDMKEGDCSDEACKKAGKKCKKCCEGSGKWPHGGDAPKK